MTTAKDKPKTPMVLIKEYFGMNAKEAIAESKALTSKDKEQLAEGIRSGSLTY